MSLHTVNKKLIPLISTLSLLFISNIGVSKTAIKQARRYYASTLNEVTLSIYNSADYIAEDEKDDSGKLVSKGIVSKFIDYCKDELGINVTVSYSTFDTNETMLSELRTGRANYDLVTPSDYVIQKMIKEDMITPFEDDSTPMYDKYVSPWIKKQMEGITINGQKGLVNKYARGYMWGTLGVLYNNEFNGVISRGITASEMDEDMMSWDSLWDKKYNNLLAIKDSMRDTYSIGILYTYREELETYKTQHDNKELSDEEYNSKLTEIFNRCSDSNLEEVKKNLVDLKNNSFGFEVDSGKVDMAKGDKFAIDIAWSGDAAYAMDMADENNEKLLANNPNAETTTLRYALPSTGANIWFDGWVMPKSIENRPGHKEIAQKFVDFISDSEHIYGDENVNPDQMTNVAQNMNYIGYTSVIAGDSVLHLIKSWYDIRYDEENDEFDESVLEKYQLVNSSEISSLEGEDLETSYYKKDISYFFEGTLVEMEDDDMIFAVLASSKNRQFDTQYPDSKILSSLCIMQDFGDQTNSLTKMWEQVKNTNLPTWAYILIIIAVVALIGYYIFVKIKNKITIDKRKERKKARQQKEKAAIEALKQQQKLEKQSKKIAKQS